MHKSEISPQAIERAASMYAPTAPLIDPRKTTHIAIDLQQAFVAEGAPFEVPGCRDIISNVNRIAAAVRETGGLNAFIRFTVDEAEPRAWPFLQRRVKADTLQTLKSVFGKDREMHRLWPGLAIEDQDLVLDKTRFSALTPGTCDLPMVLESRAMETVIITGTLTNCCCEATARDAMQMGYLVLLVEDGCVGPDDAAHNMTLSNLTAFGYAEICTADQVVQWLARSRTD